MDAMVLALALMGACLFWTAWREHRENNRRDSALMAVLGVALGSGSVLSALLG